MLTIVTINFNNDDGLRRTLISLSTQVDIDSFELIVVDGGSTDNSLQVVEDFSVIFKNMKYVSEKDRGIYDAMNKGVKLSSGNYVAFLNSGDVLSNKYILNKFFNALQVQHPDVLYSDLRLVKKGGGFSRKWASGDFKKYKLYLGWMPPHPMTIVKAEVFRNIGDFNIKFKIAADYHFLLRTLLTPNINVYYLRLCSVLMEMGGSSNSGLKAIGIANLEVIKAWYDIRGWRIPLWIIILKPIMKLLQLRYQNIKNSKGAV